MSQFKEKLTKSFTGIGVWKIGFIFVKFLDSFILQWASLSTHGEKMEQWWTQPIPEVVKEPGTKC